MKIYLIGMPLSGKSTIGKKLAQELAFNFIDLDDYIEKTYEVNIDYMLKNGHEDLFRSLETDALKEILNMTGVVIATGGGVVLSEENYDFMDGLNVFLDVKLYDLKEREKKAKKRPLLNDDNALANTYEQRLELYYGFADIIITETEIDKIVNEIIDVLYEEGFLWEL